MNDCTFWMDEFGQIWITGTVSHCPILQVSTTTGIEFIRFEPVMEAGAAAEIDWLERMFADKP